LSPRLSNRPFSPRVFPKWTSPQVRIHLSINFRADGSSYAFTDLNLEGKDIESFGLLMRQYEHVRTINMNGNKLRGISEISALPYLLEVEAKNNLIKDIDFLE
jgi:hypothetical protein